MKKLLKYFSVGEWALWGASVALIIISFCVFDRVNYLTLCASLIGATSLIFNAKGNPVGQALMIVFSVLYGIISFGFAYYGEMITYLGMTAPMALVALIAWLRHPFKGNRAEVKVNRLRAGETVFAFLLTAAVTTAFYIAPETYRLRQKLIPERFEGMLAYAANDVVLIVLWTLAAIEDLSYLSVIICFVMFLANDLYGFLNWRKMQKKQAALEAAEAAERAEATESAETNGAL